MDYKKQLSDIRNALDEGGQICLMVRESQLQQTATINRIDLMKYQADQAALLIATTFEIHKMPEMAMHALKDLSEYKLFEPLDMPEEPDIVWSPRLARCETYYEALKVIVTPSKLDNIERHSKAYGALFATIVALSAIIGAAYQAGKTLTKTDQGTQVIYLPAQITTETLNNGL